MRENIGLYRGKWRDNGEWEHGSLVIATDVVDEVQRTFILKAADFCGYGEFTGVCDIDPDTVGECSGVPDKDGVRIYEGDILKIVYLCQKPVTAVVEFTDGKFTARYTRNGNEHCRENARHELREIYIPFAAKRYTTAGY